MSPLSPFSWGFGPATTPGNFQPGTAANPQVGQPVQVPAVQGIRNALLQLRPMEHVMTLLPALVKNLTFDEVANYVYQNLEHIGNKYYVQYLLLAEPDANAQVPVPDECMQLDFVASAATCGFQQGTSATSLDEMVWMAAQPLRAAVAPATCSADPVPAEGGGQDNRSWIGPFAAWENLRAAWGQRIRCSVVPNIAGPYLQLPHGTGQVLLSYKSRLMLDGAPLLTHLEALSGAYYCEYITAHDLYMRKDLARDQYQDAKSRYEASLVPARNVGLGDPDAMAALANQMTSYHRHAYGSATPLWQGF